MKMKKTTGDIAFEGFNYTLLFILALSCLLPFIHIASLSLSSSAAATAGWVRFWPVEFTVSSYKYAFENTDFLTAFFMTVKRVLLGVTFNMAILVLTAYPLSKPGKRLPGRTFISWIFVVTMFVSGGLIPTYLVVNSTGIRDTLWALVLPGAVQAFNITVLLNFFRQIPKEMEESAVMDGAGQLRILFNIYIPLSVPALMTLLVFNTVGHWNEWFSAIIYMDSTNKYPLQTYLQTIIANPDRDLLDPTQLELIKNISNKTFQAAQILIATIPVLCVYPFLQKYFIKGMTLGSLKG